MCANCETQCAEVLADPEKAELFIARIAASAMHMGAAMAQAGIAVAEGQQLGPHRASFALQAVASVMAERFAETFGPNTAEVVRRVRERVAGRLLLVQVKVDDAAEQPCAQDRSQVH
jgi:hypothetical protein